jgi:hypothetical protein
MIRKLATYTNSGVDGIGDLISSKRSKVKSDCGISVLICRKKGIFAIEKIRKKLPQVGMPTARCLQQCLGIFVSLTSFFFYFLLPCFLSSFPNFPLPLLSFFIP